MKRTMNGALAHHAAREVAALPLRIDDPGIFRGEPLNQPTESAPGLIPLRPRLKPTSAIESAAAWTALILVVLAISAAGLMSFNRQTESLAAFQQSQEAVTSQMQQRLRQMVAEGFKIERAEDEPDEEYRIRVQCFHRLCEDLAVQRTISTSRP